jgi:phage tail sheath gpL-like
MLSTGTVAAKTPTKVFSDADAALFFGTGSIAHLSARAALQSNPYINLSVVGVADSGSTKAAGSITVTTAATYTAGQINLWIGDVMVSTGVALTDTANNIASNLKLALDQVAIYLPVTYILSSAVINFTARNAGTLGNKTVISAVTTSDAVLTVVTMAAGSTDPDVGAYGTAGTVLASVVAGGYTIFISTLNDATNLGKIKTMLAFASNPVEQRGCICVFAGNNNYSGVSGYSGLSGFEQTTAALNEGRMTGGFISYATGNLSRTESYKGAAGYAAMLASTADPVVPYDGLPIANISAPNVADRFTWAQKESMLQNGVAPLAVIPGEQVAIVRAISTYTLNSSGVPDPTLLDINTLRTLDYVRTQVRTRITNVFQRSKLNARTVKLIRAEVLDVLYVLQQAEIVQNVSTYESGVLVEQDLSDTTRVDIAIPTNIVSGLHVIGAVFNLILGI